MTKIDKRTKDQKIREAIIAAMGAILGFLIGTTIH